MKYYGTKNNSDYGFYNENFENAVEITDEYWQELLTAQNNGKKIIPFNNTVLAVNEYEYSLKNGQWVKLSTEEAEAKQLNIQNAIRAEEIKRELDTLDNKRIRAVAEPSMKDENESWLEFYNAQIRALREELSQLNKI